MESVRVGTRNKSDLRPNAPQKFVEVTTTEPLRIGVPITTHYYQFVSMCEVGYLSTSIDELQGKFRRDEHGAAVPFGFQLRATP